MYYFFQTELNGNILHVRKDHKNINKKQTEVKIFRLTPVTATAFPHYFRPHQFMSLQHRPCSLTNCYLFDKIVKKNPKTCKVHYNS